MQDFISKPIIKDWTEKLLFVLLLDYILLFGMESVLPGLVMNVFNLNYLLFFILALVFFLWSVNPLTSRQESKVSRIEKLLIILAALFIIAVTIIALYKAPIWQVALYTSLAVISTFGVWKVLEK